MAKPQKEKNVTLNRTSTKTKLTLPRKQVVQSAKCTFGNTGGY